MEQTDYRAQGDEEHQQLGEYERVRRGEMEKIYREPLEVIVNYERFICRLVGMLGDIPQKGAMDEAIRDLLAEIFDTLFVARAIILNGYQGTVFPLFRRAFEAISLVHFFMVNPGKAGHWAAGHPIENQEIRKFLADHPMGEKEASLRQFYGDFSDWSHVNRDSVPHRLLGNGNQFTLGAIGFTDLVVTTEYVSHVLGLWFWITALVSFHYRKKLDRLDPAFGHDYLTLARPVRAMQADLMREAARLAQTAGTDPLADVTK